MLTTVLVVGLILALTAGIRVERMYRKMCREQNERDRQHATQIAFSILDQISPLHQEWEDRLGEGWVINSSVQGNSVMTVVRGHGQRLVIRFGIDLTQLKHPILFEDTWDGGPGSFKQECEISQVSNLLEHLDRRVRSLKLHEAVA